MREHQRYIDFGSSQSNRRVSRVRLAKKNMRNENDSILSNDVQDMNYSLQSSSKSPERKERKKNDSPFLRISDLGNSVMGDSSNLFSQIKQF